jgi:hypothetical protein
VAAGWPNGDGVFCCCWPKLPVFVEREGRGGGVDFETGSRGAE